MKKVAVIALALTLSLCMFGCGQQSASDNSETGNPEPTEANNKTAKVGETIPVTTKYGDLEITVNGFEISDYMTDQFARYDQVKDGLNVGLLLLTVKNVSYQYNDDYVSLSTDVYVNDGNGVSMTPMSSSLDYGEYKGAAGAYFECREGQSVYVAVLYQLDPSTTEVVANIGGTQVTVPVKIVNTTEDEGADASGAKSDTQKESSSSSASQASSSQKNALSKAKDYLNYTAFSYTGLIEQLEYEKFSTEDATYGADNCGADWNEQAAKKAADYLDYTSFSRDGLIEQLEYEGFTAEQATYGVDSVGL